MDVKYEHQINDLFTSPISKKIQIHENECINKSYDKNNNIVVILSAQGKTTDKLIQEALELSKNAENRELDMLLSSR